MKYKCLKTQNSNRGLEVCGVPQVSSYYPFSLEFLLWGTRKQRETCGVPLSPLCQYPTSGLLWAHSLVLHTRFGHSFVLVYLRKSNSLNHCHFH